MKSNLGPTASTLARFCVGSLAAAALLCGWSWFASPGSLAARHSQAHPAPVGRPGLIYGARVGWDGSRFLRRNIGFEKSSPEGRREWLVPLDGTQGRPDVSASAFHPTPQGDLLVLGLERLEEPTMGLFSIAAGGGRIDRLGQYPEMEPIDLTVTPDGRIYALALSTHSLNGLLCGRVAGPVQVEENRLHELGRDGSIVRSFYPVKATVHDAREASQLIDRIDEHRLAADPSGRLALYGKVSHDLVLIDPATGDTGSTHLPQAGFPYSARIQDLHFTDRDQIVYTLVELDADSALAGCQTWQLNLETGESRVLARRRSNDEAYTVQWDPLRRQLVVFDILGLGEKGVHTSDLPDLGAKGVDAKTDLFALGERLQ